MNARNIALPKAVDWRLKGAVTDVKDQGYCGSCWAFASTGVVESHQFIKHGQLISLSEQDLIDCSESYENHGCQGGQTIRSLQYMRDNGGIDTEQSYPYRASDGVCSQNSGENANITVRGYAMIPPNNEQILQEVLATVGPVAVAFDASHPSFQSYESGIYYEPECSSSNLDHAVLVVGYGTDEHQHDYYIVKNRLIELYDFCNVFFNLFIDILSCFSLYFLFVLQLG